MQIDHLESPLRALEPGQWLHTPFHKITEPYRAARHIPGRESLLLPKLAELHFYGLLQSIDSLFNATRRLVSYLERPLSKDSNDGLTWSGKQPYNPSMVEKVLTAHRVYYNFIKIGKDGQTHAVRVGLAKAP
ncbi:hypothetical protein [uncultured Endozoicomonas sp.]|uniref:hypothetical protein n=1 Tax=uncultured Endozoicomonas sp. TaxID=432652 RepID=UPI002616D191|nr:hypothetical protein [uncultured Endozoicomonas sp.]